MQTIFLTVFSKSYLCFKIMFSFYQKSLKAQIFVDLSMLQLKVCCQLTSPEVYCHVLPQGEAAVVSVRAGAHEGVGAAHGRRGGLGLEKLERLKRKFTN